MARHSSSWRPGWRKAPPGQTEKFGQQVSLIAALWNLRMTIRRIPPGEWAEVDDMAVEREGDDILLTIQKNNGDTLYLSLTRMTYEELEAFEQVIKTAIDDAKPTVEVRDAIAKEAAENGDNSYYRLHRGSPRVSRIQRSS